MERQPKAPEVYEPEVIEEAEADEKKYLFDAKIQKAHDNFEAISRECGNSDEEIRSAFDAMHTKQRLLFCFLDTEANDYRSPSKDGYIDRNGYTINQKRFDFTPDCRHDLHREVIKELIGDSDSQEEAIEKLREETSGIRILFHDEIARRIRAEERASYLQAKKDVRNKLLERYAKIAPFFLRQERIGELCPDFDDDTASAVTSALEDSQKRYKSENRRLEDKIDGVIKESALSFKIESEIQSFFKDNTDKICALHTKSKIAERLGLGMDDKEVALAFIKFEKDKPEDSMADIYRYYKKEKVSKPYTVPAYDKSNPKDFSERILADYKKSNLNLYIEKNRLLYGIDEDVSRELFLTNFDAIKEQRTREFILQSGKMTKDELSEYQTKKNGHDASSIRDALTESYRIINQTPLPMGKESRIETLVTSLQYAIFQTEIDNFNEAEFEAPMEVKGKSLENYARRAADTLKKKVRDGEMIGEITTDIQEVKNYLIKEIAGSKDKEKQEIAAKRIEEMIARIRRRIDLSKKYNDATARVGSYLCTDDTQERYRRNDELKALHAARLEKRLGSELDDHIDDVMLDFNHAIFGKNIEESFILPTGIVLRDKMGNISATPMSPNKIRSLSEKAPLKYRSIWSSYLNSEQFTSDKYESIIDGFINQKINEDYNDNIDYAPESERYISEICERNNIPEIDTLYPASGSFKEQLSEVDAKNIEYYLGKYHRYFSNVDTDVAVLGTIAPKKPQELVKDYLARGTFPSAVCSKSEGGLSLYIKRATDYEQFFGQGAIETLIQNCIGAYVYEMNKDKLSPILQKILGNRSNISVIDSIRLTGDKVSRVADRREIANRAYFLSSYNRFLRGEKIPDENLANLIMRVDKLVFNKQ